MRAGLKTTAEEDMSLMRMMLAKRAYKSPLIQRAVQ